MVLVYVVWGTDYDVKVDSHIIGIYRSKRFAVKKCNDYNKTTSTEIQQNDDGLLGEISKIGNENRCYCTEMKIDKTTNKIYFMKISESGGGGSYHEIFWLHVSTNLDKLIDGAIDYFSNEHNRDEECDNCKDHGCQKKLISDLKKKHRASFTCTDYEDTMVEIWFVNYVC